MYFAIVFFYELMPASLMALFRLPSMALGTFIAILIALIFHVTSYKLLKKIFFSKRIFLAFALGIVFFIFLHLFVASYFGFYKDLTKAVFSSLLLPLFIIGSYIGSIAISKFSLKNLYIILYAYFLIGLVGFVGLNPFRIDQSKPYLIFSEPSHYAIYVAPFVLAFAVLFKNKYFYRVIVLMMGFLILSPSVTLLISFVLFVVVLLPLVYSLTTILIGGALMFFFSNGFSNYVYQRLPFIGEVNNISSLVWLSGWERAWLNLKNTSFLGLGIQGLGNDREFGVYQTQLASLGLPDLNLSDGGTLSAKLISELGIFGLLAISAYITYFIKSLKWLRAKSHREFIDLPLVVAHSFVIMFFIELFVRSTGYFSGSVLMSVSAMLYIADENLKK